jgi:protein gp37
MGDTSIEWTDVTWNPVRGCSHVSEGCRNCYAERFAARFSGPGQPYEGLVKLVAREIRQFKTVNGEPTGDFRTVTRSEARWTGEVRLVPERLADPLSWRKPRRVFVNSMSDLFHETLTNEQIAAVFGVMAAASKHTFQVLTKRPKRMLEWFRWLDGYGHEAMAVEAAMHLCRGAADKRKLEAYERAVCGHRPWPLPNVWIGVSVENQSTTDERIPLLLQTPAAVRFVSYEPALGPVDFDMPRCDRRNHEDDWTIADDGTPWCNACDSERSYGHWLGIDRVDWVIAGCESGPGARPAQVEWFRSVRDQCKAAGVPFFLKQTTSYDGQYTLVDYPTPGIPKITGAIPIIWAGHGSKEHGEIISLPYLDGVQHAEFPR